MPRPNAKKPSNGDFEPILSATTKNLGNRVEIRIRDNGTGIPQEVKEKMFNPFFTTKPAGEGTGLGLSMSHDIVVKQHGGTIDVATEPGAFTEFIITLPRTRSARQYWRHTLSAYILVVDDEPDVESLFRQQFRRDLRSGRFRWNSRRRRRSRWSAPTNFATLAGPDPVRHQHARHERAGDAAQGARQAPDVPVIMITAYGDAETRTKAIERGAEGLLTKPIDFCAAAPGDRHQARAGRMSVTILLSTTSPIWRLWSCRNSAGRSARARSRSCSRVTGWRL